MARRESVEIVLKPEMERFFADYTGAFARLGDLYFGDPGSIDKYVEMAGDPYLRMIKRPRLHQALTDYNRALGAPAATMENVDRLRYDGAFCVIAWQQPYILGGPLETLLKVITAVKLCERLNATGTAKFVPVLWAHADDHELSEVNRVKLPVGARLVEERLEVDERERPSEAVETGAAYDALMARLERHFEGAPHRAWVLERLAAAKGENLGEHFARLMIQLFGEHGLVLACPRIFRQEISALLVRALENPERIDRLLNQQKQAMEEKGYPSHTTWEPKDPLHLYRLSEGTPLRLKYDGTKFTLEATGGEMTAAQVATEVKRWPQIYTNGVLLSPLEQASCLPAVAHVAGPGGCEFFGVQKALFDDYRVAYPQVVPQVSATLVDARSAKGLADLGRTIDGLIADARKAAAAAGDEGPPDPAVALAKLRDEAVKAASDHAARSAEAAAEASRIASELAATVAREVARMADVARPGASRDAVLAAIARSGDRAAQVSSSAREAIAPLRERAEEALREPAALAAARADLERAAQRLVEAARPPAEPPAGKLAAGLGRELDALARAAIEAAAKGADARVSDADVAKTVCAPEGGLQEDHVGMIYFFGMRGPGLYREVSEAVDAFDFKHQVVFLD